MKNRSLRTWKTFLFFFFLLGTGILFSHSVKRYCLTKDVEKELVHLLIRKQFMNIGVLQAVHSESGLLSSQVLKDSYQILGYAEESEQYEHIKQAKHAKTKDEDKIIDGKYTLLKDQLVEHGENEEEDIKEASKNMVQAENTPVPEIVLFDNGSSDITSQNNSGAAMERRIGERIKGDSAEDLRENKRKINALYKNFSRDNLLKNFYITDSSTSIDNKIFQVKKLLTMDLKMKQTKEPQILIIHTHGASEAFRDSKKGKEDSIIGVGTRLAEILSKQYGYHVIHDKTEHDRIGGQIDRNKAYNMSLEGTKKILKKYPSIELVIDLHRDGVGYRVNRTTIVDGKKTAQVMFFNGLSRSSSGDIEYLKNPNLQGNLAFSLQLKLASMKHFKDFARSIYLKGYRYNMHLKKRYTLIELGNENNTVAEAKNAAAPLALVIHEVLTQ